MCLPPSPTIKIRPDCFTNGLIKELQEEIIQLKKDLKTSREDIVKLKDYIEQINKMYSIV